jgi:dimethylargininase
MTIAITRKISPRFNECELTHIERTPIDIHIARAQHSEYIRVLSDLGCHVIELPEEPNLPDSVFVEDTAFILPEVAVITRPGADSRKAETEAVAEAISPFRQMVRVNEPAILDGGDVLILGRNIYIGLSRRSNPSAVNQIQELLYAHGYRVRGVPLNDCLHLKTAVTRLDDQTLLINRNWVDARSFEEFKWIEVDESEPYAANCLPVHGQIIFPKAFPRTQAKLISGGYEIYALNIDELAKAEGGVTCCSLIIPN